MHTYSPADAIFGLAVVEPLKESAALAREMANELCYRNPASGEQCSWYHGLWQDLRIMGLAASPQQQSDFFLEALKKLHQGRSDLRILISGAADYSILAHALHACRLLDIRSEITVIDICNTPLKLNEWYAEKATIHINTVREDILDYTASRPFDIVCSHSFLGQFDATRRKRIVDHWKRLLIPGGAALTINRIRTETLQESLAFSAQQSQAFLATVKSKSGYTEAINAMLLERAQVYAQRLRAYAISASDLAILFTDQNYQISLNLTMSSKGSSAGGIRGLAIPAEARHACMVAIAPHEI